MPLLLPLVFASQAVTGCVHEAATVLGVQVAAGTQTIEVDVRGLPVTVTPTAAPGRMHVATTGSIVLEGVAEGVALRPRASIAVSEGALTFGPDARLQQVTRSRGATVRAHVRVGFDLRVRDVRVDCADLAIDVPGRGPTGLMQEFDAPWHATRSRVEVHTRAGDDFTIELLRSRSDATFAVLGRDSARARVRLDWGDGTLEGTVPRSAVKRRAPVSRALSGGLVNALSGTRCDGRGFGRRGGPHIVFGEATLHAGATLTDDDGDAWATTGADLPVTIDWDRRDARARVVVLPGLAAPGRCEDLGRLAWVEPTDLDLP